MGKTVKITCDGCGYDLTTRSNSVDYRLVLAAESKPSYGAGAYTDMMIYPPVDRSYYFCGLGCLDHWRSRERYSNALRHERYDEWASEHGTKDNDGRVRSYPSPPQEILGAWESEWEAAALAAFPMKSTG